MGKKVLIHTQQARVGEDFIADIQLPLNCERVNGLLINAYDREKGVTVSWGKETLQPSYTVARFLAEYKGLPEYLGRNVIATGNGNELATENARDAFVMEILSAYRDALVANETDPRKLTVFSPDYINGKMATFKKYVEGWRLIFMVRNHWKYVLGVNSSYSYTQGSMNYGVREPLCLVSRTKTWKVNDLKAWYQRFSSYMVSNPSANTPDYRETFFNESSNFDPSTYLKAKVHVYPKDNTNGAVLVDAYNYFGNLYGYPDAKWFGYQSEYRNIYSFDAYRTAEITLNWFSDYLNYVVSNTYRQNINWDKSNVGVLSVLFNSGRDIAIRDMPLDLNNNTKSIHYDMIGLSQKEQVNSFVRLVFKNNGKAVNPFYVKSYFFYQTT
jgi:hypothetical protein